jgi:lysozyme
VVFNRVSVVSFLGALIALCGLVSAQEEFPTLGDKMTPIYEVETFGGPLGAAPASGIRPLHKTALGLIKDFEGWYPDLYNDPAGYCTIGYGHLLAKRRCQASDRGEFPVALSVPEGLDLLEEDTAGTRIDVQDMVTETQLTDEQFGALTSFVFNVGRTNFKNSTLLRRLNDKTVPEETRLELAAAEFPRWVRAGGVVMGGLIARRNCEAALFQGVRVTDSSGNFNRAICDALGAMPSAGETIDILTGE